MKAALALIAGLAAAAPVSADAHPTVTELLFNVPTRDGDANKDGTRSSTGDEFVELANLTGEPIDLAGYRVTNRLTTGDDETHKGVRFEFPEFTLPPGGVVVLFNGHEAAMSGPTGDAESAPAGPNEAFSGAFVFLMKPGSKYNAFSNRGDYMLLSAPDGAPLVALVWGGPDRTPPEETGAVIEVNASPSGSVALNAEGGYQPHLGISIDAFSPGSLP